MRSTIAVISTMDTKGLEAQFLREKIEERGHIPLLIDVSTYKTPQAEPDISASAVAEAEGRSIEELVRSSNRDEIMAVMGAGAARVLIDHYHRGKVDGVLGIGGNQGTAIASTAMRALPIGFPKYLISTVVSGNIRPFIGHKDIPVVFSVSDLVGGPNVVTRSVLSNGIAALIGMVEHGEHLRPETGEKTVAISALGNTEEAVSLAEKLIKKAGYRVVAFHASGAGGSAMEDLIRNGVIDGVLDMTSHEVTEEVIGVGAYAPVTPGRMTAAIEKKIPLVVVPGGMEYVCFGPKNSIPGNMQNRIIYMHNPYNANVKITHEELQEVARVTAERLNGSSGKTALLIPSEGWSRYGTDNGPFHDPEGIRKFIEVIEKELDKSVTCEVHKKHINNPEFVARCVELLFQYMKDTKEEK